MVYIESSPDRIRAAWVYWHLVRTEGIDIKDSEFLSSKIELLIFSKETFISRRGLWKAVDVESSRMENCDCYFSLNSSWHEQNPRLC